MRVRTLLGLGLVMLLGATAISTTGLKKETTPSTNQRAYVQLPVTVNQLPQEGGMVPVELRCENAELLAPNRIEKKPCLVRNHTNKFISALTVAITIIIEKQGETSSDTSFLTIETFVHPDVRADRRDNLIPPGGELPVRDLPTSYDEEITIKGMAVRIDYVEFNDNSALGANKAGSRIIASIRAGAVKYKESLLKKMRQSGNSIEGIIPLLENEPPAEELEIQNGDEEQGVILYRNYARKIYKAKGPEGLSKFLKLAGSSMNK